MTYHGWYAINPNQIQIPKMIEKKYFTGYIIADYNCWTESDAE